MRHSAYAFSARTVCAEAFDTKALDTEAPGARVPCAALASIAALVLSLVPWLCGAGPALSQQPSFNCATSRAPDEVAICGNYALAELDRQLSDLYAAARERLDSGQQADLRDSQRDWLRQRAACRRDVSCITRLYQQRIPELSALAVPASPGAEHVTPSRRDDDVERQER